MSDQPNLPAVVETTARVVAVNPVKDKPKVHTSLDLKTKEGKRAYLAAMAPAQYEAHEMAGERWLIANILCHEVELHNKETGEVYTATRTVLISDAGENLSTTSPYLWQSLANIITVEGEPPWDPPVQVVIVKRKGSGKREFLSLDYIGR